ncbi:2-keto-4-pentenoate hydratase [Elioraea rosea]|uniref:2-keto-4-pentenoate hydratase n=1 Tax=Elioraea rosea TaxID=2492390 RepID=UPI0011824E1C|nr:fumarylacetoacetate hydrolase family protein [Elioraea rosea]
MIDPHTAAAALQEARRARRTLAPLGAIAPTTEEEGYAAQAALAKAEGSVPPAGFKVGATARAMQDYLGVGAPAAGFMARENLHPSGFATRFGDWVAPGTECEIALRLGADLPFTGSPPSREEAARAVAAVLPAIEIVEQRYADMRAVGTPTLIADQFFHGGAVLGPETRFSPEALAAGALRELAGAMRIDGRLFGEGKGADLLGDPLEVLRFLAASGAAKAFGGLRAGQVVMCGSVTPPAWLEGPAEVEVVFATLGAVTVRFA